MQSPQSIQVISKSHMTGLIVKCSLFFAIGLVITGTVLFFSAHQPLGPSYEESFARLAQLKEEMLFKSIIIYFLLTLLILAGVIFIVILYSHRVVGPLVGLKRTMGNVADGDLTAKARLREKDAIQPMADALNEMITFYGQKIKTIKEDAKQMPAFSSSGEKIPTADINLLREKAAAIQDLLRSIKV